MTMFVKMYHPQLGNRQTEVPLQSVDDHAARGWLLVDGSTPAPSSPYLTPTVADSRYLRADDVDDPATPSGLALRAALDAAQDVRTARSLGWSQLDRQGEAALAGTRGRAALTYATATEITKTWADLTGVTASANAAVSGGKLGTNNASNATVQIPVTVAAGTTLRASAIIQYGGTAGVLFGVTGTTISDFAMLGIRSTAVPSRGLKNSYTDLPDYVTAVAGDRFLVTVVVEPDNIGISMRHLVTGKNYRYRWDRNSLDTVGGILSLLCVVGQGSTIEPVNATYALTKHRSYSELDWSWFRPDTIDAAQRVRVQVPAGYDPRVPAPLAILLHNNSGSAINLVDDVRSSAWVAALSAAGFIVASADADSQSWGNDSGRAKYVALYQYVRARFAVSSVVLTGPSMGGLVALNLLARNEIPNVVAWLGIAAVTNLDSLHANATYTAGIRTALGVASDGSDYETKTAGYRPEDRAGWEFRGVPMMIVHSAADTTALLADAQALMAKVAPYAPEATVVTSTGIHMAATQFADAITYGIPFLSKYALTA